MGSVMGSECQSLSYVEVHAYFKSLLFWCSCVMCRLPFFSVAGIKDVLLLRGCFIFFYLIFMVYAYRTFYYSILLTRPRFYSSLLFLEGRHIFTYYLVYLVFNLYVAEVFRYGFELGRILVLFIFLLPLIFSFLLAGSLNSSVDFYYSAKSSGLRLYVFSSLLSYRMAIKDWSFFFFSY